MSNEHSLPETELSGGGLAAARRESADLGRELAASRRESADLSLALAASRRENADLSLALAASRRENADLGRELETAVQKAEKCCCDAEIKRHEVPPPCRTAETPENESLESRSRRFARELFGRRSERRPAATGRRRGRHQGTPSHGRTQRPELPVREEESIPDERTCPDCGKAWVSNLSSSHIRLCVFDSAIHSG